MYQPPAFRENRVEIMQDLMHTQPFATLICAGPDGLDANHLPLLLDRGISDYGRLSGHFAKANPLARALDDAHGALDVLAVFVGPDHYISPNWYPSKKRDGKAVPTWNYATVHAHGVLRPMQGNVALRAHLDALSARHEAGRAEPWSPADAPGEYLAKQMKGIIGFTIDISRLDGKWKLGQNHAAENRAGLLHGLGGEKSAAAAQLAAITPK